MAEQSHAPAQGLAAVEALMGRHSAWPLVEPAPSGEELGRILDLALRAPDHGGLKPWRFVTVEGDAREKLGEILVSAALARGEENPERFRAKALTSPLVIVPAVRLVEAAKVPEIEQWMSGAAAVMNILNGLYLMGYGGFWATGANAFDPVVRDALGFQPDERLLGFLYVGTPGPKVEPKKRPSREAFVRTWQG
ncbi:MAG: nitroreductase [Lautropia sp.]|nr:nitroreductase [Lautropia sp.]